MWSRIHWTFRLYGIWAWTWFIGAAKRRDMPEIEFDDQGKLKR